MQNLNWDETTDVSYILEQLLEMEKKDQERTVNNIEVLAYAYGKAVAMEAILNKN